MSEPPTVLLTCVGGAMAPAVLRAIRAKQLATRIIGTDISDQPIASRFVDRFFQVPKGADPEYVESIIRIVDDESVDLVIPWSDEEAVALSAAKSRLETLGCKLLASPPNVLAIISDKQETYRRLSEAGLDVPDYRVTNTVGATLSCLAEFGVPEKSAIVKPPIARGGRGLVVVVGHDQPEAGLGGGARECRISGRDLNAQALRVALENALAVTGSVMVMPCLGAPVYDADVLARDGKVSAISVRLRHNPAGVPFEGNTLVDDPNIEEYCRSIAGALRLDALHDFDLMTDARGRPVLLEVNPRMSGSIAASLAIGCSVLEIAIAQAMERMPPSGGATHSRPIDVVPILDVAVVP